MGILELEFSLRVLGSPEGVGGWVIYFPYRNAYLVMGLATELFNSNKAFQFPVCRLGRVIACRKFLRAIGLGRAFSRMGCFTLDSFWCVAMGRFLRGLSCAWGFSRCEIWPLRLPSPYVVLL